MGAMGCISRTARIGVLHEALVVLCIGALATMVVGVARAEAATVMVRFASTGTQQQFVVPAGVTSVSVVAVGGKGGGGGGTHGALGGLGTVETAEVPVSPGATLFVEVAADGGDGTATLGGSAGFNGGAPGGNGGGYIRERRRR
jgi:hypothetical protein